MLLMEKILSMCAPFGKKKGALRRLSSFFYQFSARYGLATLQTKTRPSISRIMCAVPLLSLSHIATPKSA